MAKREAFVYALSMKANNLSIIKSRRGWVIKKKKIPQTHLKLKKKEKKRKKTPIRLKVFCLQQKTKQNKTNTY